MPWSRLHAMGELRGVAEGRERAVDEAHHLADRDRSRRPPQPVPALAAAPARHDAGVLQGDEDPLEELLGDLLTLRDVADLHELIPFRLGEVEESLERVE